MKPWKQFTFGKNDVSIYNYETSSKIKKNKKNMYSYTTIFITTMEKI
ncbi:MAG: hypothetical protein CFH32_00964 [Alphaproteobacteria bacterium MarineAlpha9_Bin2]|nr:MAG: hypothetical protein CFH31_01073 [Alphaproteobacteria bacterium MarineAlpha9_Bin1]PPR29987.1 MAG: hypothetical protein CFH32_00964 [Alphaproteobacteria bacterium MarineAlpha9_Bin2]